MDYLDSRKCKPCYQTNCHLKIVMQSNRRRYNQGRFHYLCEMMKFQNKRLIGCIQNPSWNRFALKLIGNSSSDVCLNVFLCWW
jgi:hypothetical protein